MFKYKNENVKRARELRKNATRQEKHLWYDYLSKYEIRFQRQKPIGYYIVDFYCDKAKLVVEIDGAQHYEPEEMEYDENRTKYLEKLGISVIRFVNSDVDKNFDGVCAVIDNEVKARI